MAVLALMLVLVNPASGFGWAAGGGTDSSGEAGLAARKHWWGLDRARPCGRFWCSVVVSPHIPLGPGEPRIRLAVAGAADGASPQDSAARVEARSTAVATSLRELASQLEASVRSAPTPPPSLGAGLWLDRQQKPRHPLTPSLAIATKNNSPVIVLPADEANSTPLVTLITLTEPDSIANGLDTEALAQRWKEILERTLSEALWGASFDRRFPWARATMVALAAAFGAAGVLVCSRAVRRRRQRVLALGHELIELQQSRSSAEQHNALPGGEATAEVADGQALRQVQQLERAQRHQTLTIKLIRVLRIAVVVMAVILALFVLPGSRLLALALLRQSAWIPVIWLVMIVLEGLLSWSLVRRLNQWAEQAQLAEPNSRRPQQRLGTNLGVIKGTIDAGTTLLGFYLTLLLFGLTPEILAGAGIVAVAVGFLARGLVEDLIGGVRILTADLYAVGDSIAANGHAGLVEGMNLLYTQLRGGGGELISLPNGAIRECENRSKDWARVNFELDIAWRSDLARACALLQSVATELAADPQWGGLILEEPQLLGVEQLDQSGVRLKLWIKTQPLKQWSVAREYRRRIKLALDGAGIEPGMPQWVSRQG